MFAVLMVGSFTGSQAHGYCNPYGADYDSCYVDDGAQETLCYPSQKIYTESEGWHCPDPGQTNYYGYYSMVDQSQTPLTATTLYACA